MVGQVVFKGERTVIGIVHYPPLGHFYVIEVIVDVEYQITAVAPVGFIVARGVLRIRDQFTPVGEIN